MAVGFTPHYSKEYLLHDLTPNEFLVLLHEAAGQMKWHIAFLSENGIIANTQNGIWTTNQQITIRIADGVATIHSESSGEEITDLGKNKKNVHALLAIIESLKTSMGKAEMQLKYEPLKEEFVPEEDNFLALPPEPKKSKVKELFSLFIPVKNFTVTPILFNINLLVFILMVVTGVDIFLPSNEELIKWGANFGPSTLNGEAWRLITSCFVHIGILHILFNVYALLYIGFLLEPILGSKKFGIAYLLTGLASGIASLWWNDYKISAGASGAIFGMYGVFLALLTTNFIDRTARKPLLISIGLFVVFNLLNGLKDGVDNAAHLGGLLSGIFIGYIFIPGLKDPLNKKVNYTTIIVPVVLVLSGVFIMYRGMPNDVAAYDTKMSRFTELETEALGIFNMPEDVADGKLLSELDHHGIVNWNQALIITDEISKLDLPDELDGRNILVKHYCELRIRSYELMYKSIENDTNEYDDEINTINQEIQALVLKITGRTEILQ